jgi:hypothetical protein
LAARAKRNASSKLREHQRPGVADLVVSAGPVSRSDPAPDLQLLPPELERPLDHSAVLVVTGQVAERADRLRVLVSLHAPARLQDLGQQALAFVYAAQARIEVAERVHDAQRVRVLVAEDAAGTLQVLQRKLFGLVVTVLEVIRDRKRATRAQRLRVVLAQHTFATFERILDLRFRIVVAPLRAEGHPVVRRDDEGVGVVRPEELPRALEDLLHHRFVACPLAPVGVQDGEVVPRREDVKIVLGVDAFKDLDVRGEDRLRFRVAATVLVDRG